MPLVNAIAEALGERPEQVASTLGLDSAEDREVAAAIMANAAGTQTAQASPGRLPEFVADALGVPGDADETTLKAALIRLKAPGAGLAAVRSTLGLADDAPELEVLNSVAGLMKVRRRCNAEELIDEAVAEGRIPPAHRAFYLREAEIDLDAARAVINSLPVLMEPQPGPGRSADVGRRDLSAGERSVCRQLGLSAEAFLRAEAP